MTGAAALMPFALRDDDAMDVVDSLGPVERRVTIGDAAPMLRLELGAAGALRVVLQKRGLRLGVSIVLLCPPRRVRDDRVVAAAAAAADVFLPRRCLPETIVLWRENAGGGVRRLVKDELRAGDADRKPCCAGVKMWQAGEQ